MNNRWFQIVLALIGLVAAGVVAGIINWSMLRADVNYAAKDRARLRKWNESQTSRIGNNERDVAVLKSGFQDVKENIQTISSDIKDLLDRK